MKFADELARLHEAATKEEGRPVRRIPTAPSGSADYRLEIRGALAQMVTKYLHATPTLLAVLRASEAVCTGAGDVETLRDRLADLDAGVGDGA